jgi:hypothetical protein
MLNPEPFDDGRNILCSYHYFKTVDLVKLMQENFTPPYPRIILDSGAWSAFTQGVPISLDEYIDYINRNRSVIWWYSNLDDMTDHKRTLHNQTEMERQGFAPVPVFHTGEPWSALQAYVEQYRYLALGKIIPFTTSPKVIIPWVAKCFRIAEPYRTTFHGFGVSNMTLLKLFRWSTADSSSWAGGYRFGRVPLFDPQAGKFFMVAARDPVEYNRHREALDEHGYQHFRLYEVPERQHEPIGAVSVVAFLKMNAWLRRAKSDKFSYFFAASNAQNMLKLKHGMDFYFNTQRGSL